MGRDLKALTEDTAFSLLSLKAIALDTGPRHWLIHRNCLKVVLFGKCGVQAALLGLTGGKGSVPMGIG
jgi:hypothetical protein